MKHYLICVFFVFSISLICAENFDKNGKIIDLEGLYYDTGITSDIKFSERKLTSRDYEKGSRDNNYVIHSSNVSLKSDSNISFILTDSGERYLILANPELMVLYKQNQKQPHVVGTNLKGILIM